MPELLLYDNPASSNALKVRILLAAMDLPYGCREIPMTRPRPPEYLALNPLGGIPALRDGELVISESHTILRHLARREGRADLYPDAAAERAAVDEFLDRFATRLRPAFFEHERVALGYRTDTGFDAVARDPERAATVAAAMRPELELLERLVSADGAVLGRFTIADCSLGAILFRTTVTGLDLGPFPRLLTLRERLLAQPWWPAARAVT